MKIMMIGPCSIKECETGVNNTLEAAEIRVLDITYLVVSPNFVHPKQSYMMAVVSYEDHIEFPKNKWDRCRI